MRLPSAMITRHTRAGVRDHTIMEVQPLLVSPYDLFRRYRRAILHHDNLKMDIGLLAKA